MEILIVIILIYFACKILFGRDVKGGIDDHVIWEPSPITTGLKSILRIVLLFIIVAVLLACCSGM